MQFDHIVTRPGHGLYSAEELQPYMSLDGLGLAAVTWHMVSLPPGIEKCMLDIHFPKIIIWSISGFDVLNLRQSDRDKDKPFSCQL